MKRPGYGAEPHGVSDHKALQPGATDDDEGPDPERMDVETDGQEAFDAMWADGDTVSPDGYLDRPLAP